MMMSAKAFFSDVLMLSDSSQLHGPGKGVNASGEHTDPFQQNAVCLCYRVFDFRHNAAASQS